MGAAIAIAFKDTKDKAEDMKKNQALFVKLGFIEENSDEHLYLVPFSQVEMKHNVQVLSGDNNKKIIKKMDKKAV